MAKILETTIRDLNCEFLYCLPSGNFFEDIESKITFIDLLANPVKNPIDLLIQRLPGAKSSHLIEYQSDRGASSIITSLNLDSPLYEFQYEQPVSFSSSNLSAIGSSFTLSSNGTICICYKIENTNPLSAGDAVLELAEIRASIKEELSNSFKSAFELIKKEMKFSLFENVTITNQSIFKWLKTFEIIDFDFRVGRRQGHTILRDYYSGKSQSLPADLTGFIRMTRQGVWNNYKPNFQKDFWAQNLGNRTDEIWLIHVKHFFRFHPERKKRDSVTNFYSEVSLSIKKLLHSIAHISFLSRTMHDFRLTENSDWQTVLKFSDNLSEQAPQVPEYSNHDFFSRLMVSILDEYNFDSLIKNFNTQLGEIKSSTIAYTSLLSAKRVNRLTIVVLGVTALQAMISSENSTIVGSTLKWILDLVPVVFYLLISFLVSKYVWISAIVATFAYFVIFNKRFDKLRFKIWLKYTLLKLNKK